MDKPLLDCADRQRLREFTAHAMVERPGLLEHGAAMADQFRQLIPSLGDEQIAAVTAVTAQLAGATAQTGRCVHAQKVALLLQAVTADLAHLELDPPGRL